MLNNVKYFLGRGWPHPGAQVPAADPRAQDDRVHPLGPGLHPGGAISQVALRPHHSPGVWPHAGQSHLHRIPLPKGSQRLRQNEKGTPYYIDSLCQKLLASSKALLSLKYVVIRNFYCKKGGLDLLIFKELGYLLTEFKPVQRSCNIFTVTSNLCLSFCQNYK